MLQAKSLLRLLSSTKLKKLDIGNSTHFTEGSVKKVEVGSGVAVARVRGQIYAVSNSCPHHGAPLHTGYLDHFSLTCPWHLAEFDVRTGEMKAAPALKSLTSFKTSESNGHVFLEIPEDQVSSPVTPVDSSLYVSRNPGNLYHYVIIGGGAAAQTTAETLRKAGFEGRISMISKESQLPYDRTALSKDFKAAALGLRPEAFYQALDIEVKLGTEIARLDATEKVVLTVDGTAYKFDKLCVATGSRPFIPKEHRQALTNLKNVFSLRSAEDHTRARSCIEDAQQIVIIGGSLLGFESAKSIKSQWPDKTVTVIEASKHPLSSAFGPIIASSLVESARANGVVLKAGVRADLIVHLDTHAVAVKVGERHIKADAVMLATGAQVATDFMPEQMIFQGDKSVFVNSFMQSTHPDIYAAGDIVNFPSLLTETRHRVEHWKVAQDHGITAALNMMGRGKPYASMPFYWTDMFSSVQFVGFSSGANRFISKDLTTANGIKNSKFTVFYRDNTAIGVATLNIPNGPAVFKLALEHNLLPRERTDLNYDEVLARVRATSSCSCPLLH